MARRSEGAERGDAGQAMNDVRGSATGIERVVPYVLVFCVAAFLLYRAEHFEFTASIDQVGPDSWPKLILYMIMATSVFEGVRRLLTARSARSGPAIVPVTESPFERERADMRVVLTCVAASLVYLALFEIVGFFVDTLFFVMALIWIGRFRHFWTALAISTVTTLLFMLVFMRVIFVALPIGVGPFEWLSTSLMRLLGVH
jgi:putative tricarboxylic transport membrane protein